MRQQGEHGDDSMTICAKLSMSPTKSDRSVDSVKHAPKSNMNKENEDNTGNPVGLKSNCDDIKKVKSLQTSAITSPLHVGMKSATPVPKSSPDAENIRTEHQVVTSTKPLSKPLVLATRVAQVHTSPQPTENTRESSMEDQAKNCDEPDDEFVVPPKVSRLKAMFESSDSGSQAKDESCARVAKTAGTSKFANMKSPLPSRLSPKQPGSVVKSDVLDANAFDSSTAPTGALANTLVTERVSFHCALHYAYDCLYEQS